MPDPAILDISAARPALSATSDAPMKTGEAAPVDNAAEAGQAPITSESEAPAASSDGEATDSPGEPRKSGEDSDVPPWVKARISREEARRKAAEERAANLESRVDELVKALPKQEPAKEPPAKPRPTRDAFTDPDAYEDALVDWAAEQAAARTKAETEAARETNDRQQALKRTLDTYQTRKADFAKDHPDFDDVTGAPDLQINAAMTAAIIEAEDGPALAYYLGQNPEVAKRIAGLSPVQAAAEMGKLSAKLSSTPVRTKPAPIEPVRSRNSAAPKSPENESMEEYAARRLNELRAERRPFVKAT